MPSALFNTASASVMPASALKEETVSSRNASDENGPAGKAKKQMRDIGDIMRVVNGFVFLTCACGLKMKVPPNFKGNKVKCPRCKKISAIA